MRIKNLKFLWKFLIKRKSLYLFIKLCKNIKKIPDEYEIIFNSKDITIIKNNKQKQINYENGIFYLLIAKEKDLENLLNLLYEKPHHGEIFSYTYFLPGENLSYDIYFTTSPNHKEIPYDVIRLSSMDEEFEKFLKKKNIKILEKTRTIGLTPNKQKKILNFYFVRPEFENYKKIISLLKQSHIKIFKRKL